jgi:putative PIN family toxin of toxin-antitoxin system
MRVIADTNVFVSALISPKGNAFEIVHLWRDRRFEILMSEWQRLEIERVINRPKFSNFFTGARHIATELLTDIDRFCEIVDSGPVAPVAVRDQQDQALLDSALNGNADFLVTGDLDLLVLRNDLRIVPLMIGTPYEFLVQFK